MSSQVLVKTPVVTYIPSVLSSPRLKKPVHALPNFHVLDPATQKTLIEKDDTIIKNKKVIQELQDRFASLQARVFIEYAKF